MQEKCGVVIVQFYCFINCNFDLVRLVNRTISNISQEGLNEHSAKSVMNDLSIAILTFF